MSFCLLGTFCKKLMNEEVRCDFVSLENLVILDHSHTILLPLSPQVNRAIALLLAGWLRESHISPNAFLATGPSVFLPHTSLGEKR